MKRRSNESKSRVVKPDLGETGDDKYFTASSWGYPDLSTRQAIETTHSLWYASGKYQRTTSTGFASWPLGSESLNSATGGYGLMNNCTHVRQRAMQLPVTAAHRNYWGDPGVYFESYYRYGTSYSYVTTAANTALRLGAQYNNPGFSARAFWSMRPKFQSDSALLNSIFELKDFSELGTGFVNNLSTTGIRRNLKKANRQIRAFRRGPKGFVKPFADKSIAWLTHPSQIIGDLAQIAATAQLTYSLAIMPTIRDVAGIHANAVKSVRSLGEQFKALGDEGARSHYSENFVHQQSITPGSKNNYWRGDGTYVRTRVTATMVSYYRVLWKRFEDVYPYWWGLELGVDEIWNILPLSFLLDYILTIGKSLEYMDVDKNVNVLSTEYCESVKVLADYGQFILYDTRVPLLGIDGVLQPPPTSKVKPLLVTGTRGSYYRRQVMEPYKGPALPQLKLPSTNQAANMLALAKCILF